MISKEMKQEVSIPVQSRVSIVSLANLDIYWERTGYNIKTMSQLISWSIDLLYEVLKTNNVVPIEIESVVNAHRHLEMKGLYQPSMKKKGFKKIGTALRFESLREEGIDPKQYVPRQHQTIHRKGSVEPLEGKVVSGKYSDVINEAFETAERLKKEEIELLQKKSIEAAKDSGYVVKEGMNEEEFESVSKEREEGVQKKENASIDMEFLKGNIVVK